MSRPADEVVCSVLVPVLNEIDHIERAVRSIRAQRIDGRIELLLIDGGSRDGTREVLEELALEDERIRVLSNPRGVIPAALNIGLDQARGDWIARMDAHSEFPADYLACGIDRLRTGDVSWVSGPQQPVGYNRLSHAVALALGGWLGSGPSRRWASRQDGGELELDSGVFCGIWARETLLAIGGWDERWQVNEDSELAGRFIARGKRLVCLPELLARYTPRGTLRELWHQYRQYGEFRVRTAVRHPATLRRSHLLAPTLLVCVLAALTPWGWLDLPGRAGLAVYAVALLASAWQARRRGGSTADAALVPIVLITMHAAHGWGFLRGSGRWGLPVRGLLSTVGIGRRAGVPGRRELVA